MATYNYSNANFVQRLLRELGKVPESEKGYSLYDRLFNQEQIKADRDKALANDLRNSYGGALNDYTDAELASIVDSYYTKDARDDLSAFFTGDSFTFDRDAFEDDFAELEGADAAGLIPTSPNIQALYNEAQQAIAAENAEMYARYDAEEALLNQLRDARSQEYSTDLQNLRDEYNAQRTGTLSRQATQNAQLMDTMQSQLSRAQRNAIESGASAGLRIAENVNTALSVQNRQSQQSLETSNQLAQMLLNQRAAERGLRSDYNDYMSEDATRRSALNAKRDSALTSTQSRINDRYQSAYNREKDAYDQNYADYTAGFGNNAFAQTYHTYKTKSKFTQPSSTQSTLR